jgi:hypothetical protein
VTRAAVTGIVCVSCDPARVEAVGWVGTGDVGDDLAAKADTDGRVWLCGRHLNPIWNDARRGGRLPLPGQEVLFP